MNWPIKIACLCVTEDRAPIWPIALTSYLEQTGRELQGAGSFSPWLNCDSARTDPDVYYQAVSHLGPLLDNRHAGAPWRTGRPWQVIRLSLGGDPLPFRLARLINDAFYGEGADLVTVWDDDDYSPPDRLHLTAQAVADLDPRRSIVGGYNKGRFVNLVTLQGEEVDCPWGLWGASLTFNRVAYEAAGGFSDRVSPGYDRSFVADLMERQGQNVQRFVLDVPPERRPMAFSHGKNIATWLKTRGEPMEARLKAWMPSSVFQAVKAGQGFLVERRVVPPQP